jgi:hypothetical protein
MNMITSKEDRQRVGEEVRKVLATLYVAFEKVPGAAWLPRQKFVPSKGSHRFTTVIENLIGEGYFEIRSRKQFVRKGRGGSPVIVEYRVGAAAGWTLLKSHTTLDAEALYEMFGKRSVGEARREARLPISTACRKCQGRIEGRPRSAKVCVRCDAHRNRKAAPAEPVRKQAELPFAPPPVRQPHHAQRILGPVPTFAELHVTVATLRQEVAQLQRAVQSLTVARQFTVGGGKITHHQNGNRHAASIRARLEGLIEEIDNGGAL